MSGDFLIQLAAQGTQMFMVLLIAPLAIGVTRRVKARLMRREGALFGGGVSRANIHPAIDEGRIDADDLDRPPRGERQRGGRLARSGRSEQAGDRRDFA